MRHPVLESTPARAAHPPKQPATREPSSQQSTLQRPRRSPAPTAAAAGAANQHPQLASFSTRAGGYD